jgi:hypothetical protein
MSAARTKLINICGQVFESINLVGTGLSLPDYWPGDDVGKQEIFPDKETTGRQVFRAAYTAVSFTTLGNAFFAYLSAAGIEAHRDLSPDVVNVSMGVAALSFGVSLTSLLNPSPLSLMPGFQMTQQQAKDAALPLGLQRSDSIKLQPRGLTRITRHPLILPSTYIWTTQDNRFCSLS